MAQVLIMTAFACPFFFVSVFIASSVQAYSSLVNIHSSPVATVQNSPAARISGASEWQIASARHAQYARASQKNAARRQQVHFAQDHYPNPTQYKTLPDEVLQNRPPVHFPVNHFQSLEYEANDYRPANKYPQSIETYSHNYRSQPAIYEEQYQRRPEPNHHVQQFGQHENNFFDQNQRPHASPYVQLEQQENTNNNYIDYPPYPNQNVNANQISQNPTPNTFSSYETHKQPPYLESPTVQPQFQNNIHSSPYSGPFAPQFTPHGAGMQRFPFAREPSFPSYPPANGQHPRNPPLQNKPRNPYFYQPTGHQHPPYQHQPHPHPHPPHPSHANHPPSYYDPDPELTAELQQLDKEFHAQREGLSGGGKSMYRLLVPLLMLGFSIPALGYMYTFMSRRREFRSGSGSNADNQSARVEYYSDLLARAMTCYQQGDKCLEQKRRK